MPPKLKNSAPWWWGPAVCELWAANHTDTRRAKFYAAAVDALDAVHVGGVLVVVKQKINWGCAGKYTTDRARLRVLICGATATLFDNILTAHN